jgi:hypothetical protein
MIKEMTVKECVDASGVSETAIYLWIKKYNLLTSKKLINGRYHTILDSSAVNFILNHEKYSYDKKIIVKKSTKQMKKTMNSFLNDLLYHKKLADKEGIKFNIGTYMEYWRS